MVELVITTADGRTQRQALTSPVVLGRDPSCDVPLDDLGTSRRHARIHPEGDGFVLEDLGSKNGTILNGHTISGPTPLHHLDVIVVSTVRLIVRKVSSSVETESAEP